MIGRPWLLLVTGTALSFTACNGRTAERSATPARDTDPRTIAIALERTACFGRCPIYRVDIDDTGLVLYQGTAFVAHAGADSARVTPERVVELVEAADRLGYFDLADSYRMDDPTCPEYFTDAPSIILSVSAHGRTKRVEVDQGCVGFPSAVPELAQLIDEAAGVHRWIGEGE